MQYLDYITIITFSLIILVAGLSFGKKGTNMKSFFAAGGSVPWSMNGLSLFMSFFSAGTFVVWGSIAYKHGLVAITIQMAMCIAGFVIGYFIAPRWWNSKALTVAEFLTNRFGKRIQQYYTYIFLFLSLGYTGAFLYPVAKILNVTTGFDINYAILLLGGMIMVYTAVGGLWAVVVTDVLQFVILTAAVLLVIPLSIKEVDGLNNFINQAPDQFFDIFSGEYTYAFIIAFMFYNIVFIGGNWAYVQRYTSVKDSKSSSKVGYLFGALYLISPLIWMLPPMIYRVLNPDLQGLEAEGAYLMICKQVLPVGILGLMLGGMIFATASSVNTSLNLAAAVLTNDVFKPLRPNSSDKTLMKVARWATILFGIGTILVAFMVPMAGGIVEVVLSIAAITGGALYGPAIWALFSKKQTGKSILGVTAISLVINIFFKFISPKAFNFALNRTEELILGVGIPFTLLLLYEIFGARAIKHPAEAEPQTGKTPETIDESGQNEFGIKVLGYSFIAIGLMFCVLSIWGGSSSIYLIIIGALIIGLGVFLARYAIAQLKKNNLPYSVTTDQN
ncbi:sodium:solute symporter family protein [Cognataquiflexum rubidum]|uniref:sodium:solute symporter family protein n=1 Tax=Cognataquiflexum rubidum TaxID=2922273 RepID=UPI001F12AC01|nr:sodium:solute symporter family protein [Cognataquiflexum rubidum]MCH6235583.1 Na+:solute symporter [Cognataquiflexum rubidum]